MRRCLAVAVSVAAIAALTVAVLLVRSQEPARAYSTAIGSLTNTGVLTVTNPGAAADEISVSLVIASGNPTGLHVTNAPGCGSPALSETYSDTGGPLAGRLYTTTSNLVWPTACIDYLETLTLAYSTFPGIPLPGPFGVPVDFLAGGAPVLPPTSTPGPSPTPVPPFSLYLDCDTATAGVQDNCVVTLGAPSVDLAVILFNNTGSPQSLKAADFKVRDPDNSRLDPPGTGGNLDGNPDFNQAIGGTWTCPSVGNVEGEDGPGTAVSHLGCSSTTVTTLPPGPVTIATVHYSIPGAAAAGSVLLKPDDVSFSDAYSNDFASCPVVDIPMLCFPATVTLVTAPPGGTPTSTFTATSTPVPPTPTPTSASIGSSTTATPANTLFLAIDCDTSLPWIQTDCTYFTDVGNIDAAVVFVNNSGATTTVGPFNFDLQDPDTSRLNPPLGLDTNLDANPDFNQTDVTGNWFCGFALTDNDTGAGGPGTATSRIVCIQSVGFPNGPALPPANSIAIARVHYIVPIGAQPGSVALSLKSVSINNNRLEEVGSCGPPITNAMPCLPATVHLIAPLPTTPTATPTASVAAVVKVPEGNANNVNSAIPAANLWLCIAPAPCAGAGEGDLRVIEHATNVVTGDQNGDSLPDGLGAYEFSVEYDNFVIESVNPCDIVFGPTGAGATRGPVDELDTSAANADCAPDPGGANNGTCSMSAILENIIHFGCTTSGPLPPGPNGSFDLASLDLIPHPDLRNDIFPGNNNGVVTVIKDNGCELVDAFGHAVLGSVNGGLTLACGDLAVTVRILEGDLNLDCKVDAQDQQLIAYRYGSFFGIDLYSKWFDLEPALHDLDIDIKDLQKVFGRDGSTCQDPVPAQPPLAPPAPFGD